MQNRGLHDMRITPAIYSRPKVKVKTWIYVTL